MYKHPLHVIGLNIGALIQAAPQLFGELQAELGSLIASGVLMPARPSVYRLSEGADLLSKLENRTTVGKLALIP